MEQSDSMNVYVIRDVKLKTCGPLFLAKDDDAAKELVSRSFLLPDGSPTNVALYSEGYALLRLGSFDMSECDLRSDNSTTCVCRLDELVRGVVSVFKSVSRSASAFLEAFDKKGED